MRIHRLFVASAVSVLAACGGNKPAEAPRDPNAPAGEVVAVEGEVTAKRASATTSRALAIDGDVFADDDVTTGAAASVQIRLAHNEAIWTVGESKTLRVDASAAWSAPKQSGGDLMFTREDREDRTRAAARSGSQEGVSSGEAALDVEAAKEEPRKEEGQMGKRDNPKRAASAYTLPPPSSEPAPPKNETASAKSIEELAGNGGLLGDKSLSDSLANQTGAQAGSPDGLAGLGIKGTGSAGGGSGETIGIGQIGTKGAGGGSFGYGSGSGSRGKDEAGKVSLASFTVLPAEREAVVKKVVQQNFAQLRYCVERGWITNPSMAGRLTVKFVVGPDGTVTSSAIKSATGTIDSSTQTCVSQRFMRWTFPKPENGGITIVEVPVLAVIDETSEPAPAESPAPTAP